MDIYATKHSIAITIMLQRVSKGLGNVCAVMLCVKDWMQIVCGV
jgi:hypothetical protein